MIYSGNCGTFPPAGGSTAFGVGRAAICMTCHNSHTTTRYMDISGDLPGRDTACTECHSADDYEITTGGMTGLDCIDCHMPLLAKSALPHDAVGTEPATGDIKMHIVRINLSATAQITDDGEFACKTCHNGETAFNLDFPSGLTIHNN